jgi:hypothetical protein
MTDYQTCLAVPAYLQPIFKILVAANSRARPSRIRGKSEEYVLYIHH